MNLFRNLKITHQFVTLFGILILGFVAVGVAYKQVLDVERSSTSRIQRASKFGDLVNRVSGDLSAMSSEEQAFLLTNELQHTKRFKDLLGKVQQEIDTLEKTIPDPKALGLVSQMQDGLAVYDDAFNRLVNTRVLLGLNENSGLHGELRSAIHEVESTLGRVDQVPLVASMLQMRRYEKNFIQRRDPKYIQQMREEQAAFADLLKKARLPANLKDSIGSEMTTYSKAFNAYARTADRVETRTDDVQTAQYVLQPLLDALLEQKDALIETSLASVAAERGRITVFFSGSIIAAGAIVAAVLLFLTLRMRRSLRRLHDTVQKVAQGDFTARSQLATGDELGALSNAFDNLLNERVATLSKVEQENEALNESIIALMGAVARLSQKDLTVKAVVAEDVTGPVSDAVNLMASETTKVLSRIREVSQDVERAANAVRSQAEKVSEAAGQERRLVQESADELKQAALAMAELAKGAQGANHTAGVAMEHTQNALAAVSTTVGGIEQIRDIIRETEKRIKRLGERSQEITGAVNLINTIAERTHILALNASMHAASAGEAGRGFAVVADEVQRLAESSRGATSDIASMVNAIRVETVDTVDTMNRVIAQVAEGTRLAQQAGQRMQETEATTAELVAAVQHIAGEAEQQARAALALMERSQTIVESTEQTSEELREQSAHTVSLVDYSNALRESVGVFKLPTAAA